jgi:hypothetical protein
VGNKYPSTLLVSLADKLEKIADKQVRQDIETEIRKADLDLLAKDNELSARIDAIAALSLTFKVGNTTYQYGKAYAYTPTFQGFGTPTAITFYWKRNFLSNEITIFPGKFTTGTVTAVEARVGLPILDNTTQLVSDSTLVPSIVLCGYWVRGTNPGAAAQPAVLIESNVGYVTFGFTSGGLAKVNGNAVFNNTEAESMYCSVSIQGWNA